MAALMLPYSLRVSLMPVARSVLLNLTAAFQAATGYYSEFTRPTKETPASFALQGRAGTVTHCEPPSRLAARQVRERLPGAVCLILVPHPDPQFGHA